MTDKTENKKPRLHIAFDIEGSGDRFSDQVIQIGVAMGHQEAFLGTHASVVHPFATRSFCFQPSLPWSIRYWWLFLVHLVTLTLGLQKFHWTVLLAIAILLTTIGIRLMFDLYTYKHTWGPTNIQPRCYDEFWSKHLPTLTRINRDARPAREQWHAFYQFISKLTRENPDCVLLSDNPSYDLMRIDLGLLQNVHGSNPDRYPIRYSVGRPVGNVPAVGKYLGVKDPSERIKGLGKKAEKQVQDMLDKRFPHTHWAPDDASRILAMHFLVMEVIERVGDT